MYAVFKTMVSAINNCCCPMIRWQTSLQENDGGCLIALSTRVCGYALFSHLYQHNFFICKVCHSDLPVRNDFLSKKQSVHISLRQKSLEGVLTSRIHKHLALEKDIFSDYHSKNEGK